MKSTKTVVKIVDYMYCDDLASYLNQMALKGWHFKEWRFGLVFEKGEPENATYAVEVFSEASENDTRPSPTTKEFAEYCEAAGWKLIDGKQKYCIFKKIQEDAVDILTPEERVNNAFKATITGSNLALLFLYALNACLQVFNLTSFFSTHIFSKSSLYSVLVWVLLFIMLLIKLTYAFIKKHQLMRKINNGEDVYLGKNNKKGLRINGSNVMLFLLILLLGYDILEIGGMNSAIIAGFVLISTFALSWVIGRFRPDSDTNAIIQVLFGFVIFIFLIGYAGFSIFSTEKDVVTPQDLPLLVSDYRDISEVSEIDDISRYQGESFFGRYYTYFIWSEDDTVSYTVYRSEYDWVLDKIWNDELDKKVNESVTYCTEDWEATIAFKNNADEYLVRYENAILIFREYNDTILTSDQINIIRNKLDLR